MSDDEDGGTDDFYLTADFDQNLNLLRMFRSVDPQKADLLQIKSSAFMGQQITSIGQAAPVTRRAAGATVFQQTHPTDVFISPSYL